MRRFAADHIKAHARLAAARLRTGCACGSMRCALHQGHVQCSGTKLLILVHDPAVGQVWTLAEVCQTCARQIPHTTVLATGRPTLPAPTAPVTAQPVQRAAVPGGFSSPRTTPDTSSERHRPYRPRRQRG
ncbi:hypothetical protein ACFQ7B_38975 [Streptomyces erythrochromogenes]|uniref:hypothetical protein n=1 Tax=Streptomyces erythrochromogenes TaxID=285574 RepID=UPI0036BC8C65